MEDSTTKKPAVDVLLIENDPLFAKKLKKHLSATATDYHFHQVRNGAEALDFLKRREAHTQAPHPQLVILDVNIPMIDGYQVLGIMKNSDVLKNVPTIVIEDDPMAKERKTVHTLNASKDINPAVDAVRSFIVNSLKGKPL